MCGIAGWIDWVEDLTQRKPILERMTQTLAARGPDASGYWFSTHAAIGHRRLIVVDAAGGIQPMVRRFGDRTYVLTYNGELYNTEEIRRDLKTLGAHLRILFGYRGPVTCLYPVGARLSGPVQRYFCLWNLG